MIGLRKYESASEIERLIELLKFSLNNSLSLLKKEIQKTAPWKLNIESIMMQLWEQQKEIYLIKRVIKSTILLKNFLMSLHNSTN